MPKELSVKVGRRTLELSNLQKVFFPAVGFTKGDVITFYREIAPVILPHLKNRPLTLKRYPDGVTGKHFYEKEAPRYTPEWVRTFAVPRKEARGGDTEIDYVLITDEPSLIWTVNLANVEMHTFLARAPQIDRPSSVVFDLDPGPPADIIDCCTLALELRRFFETLELECVVKVSGSKGLQLYVPLNGRSTYDVTKPFAETVARLMEEQHPDLAISKMQKSARVGKVLIDWSQNEDFKTTVAPYSMRAKSDRPYISLPVQWKEVERAAKNKDAGKLYFEPKSVLKRVEKLGDLFASLLTLKQSLPKDFQQAVREPTLPRARKPLAKNGASRPTGSTARRGVKGTDMEAYRAKRNFSSTAEPKPEIKRGRAAREPRFVIQKHAASHLHYDFRLEMEGALRSWAVPKGPSTKRGERRLAMHVEDHPLDYADFEGTIAPGNYGAGTVMVWDTGTYSVRSGDPAKEYRAGRLHLTLSGSKLKGEWALVRAGDEKSWFLIKSGDDARPVSKKSDDQSVLTKRTMSQIARQNTAQWASNRKESTGSHRRGPRG